MTATRINDISHTERKAIWKRHDAGDTIDRLSVEFHRSRPRIRAVLVHMERDAHAKDWNSVQLPGWQVHGELTAEQARLYPSGVE